MTFTIKKKNNTTWYKRSTEMNSRKYTSNVGCFLAFWLSYWLLDIDYCLKLFKLEQIAILFNSCRLVQTFRKILAKSGCLHAYELSTDNYYNLLHYGNFFIQAANNRHLGLLGPCYLAIKFLKLLNQWSVRYMWLYIF